MSPSSEGPHGGSPDGGRRGHAAAAADAAQHERLPGVRRPSRSAARAAADAPLCVCRAQPIRRCLDLGADVVVTGRCVDSAVALGPLMHAVGLSAEP